MKLDRVAVTGGSGVVGGAVVRQLLDRGATVTALARSGPARERLATLGASPVSGDVMNPDSLVEAFRGCDVVFHVAGVNEMCSRDPARMYEVNVEGTRHVIRSAKAAGVRRVVLTSSAATIGEEEGQVATERTPHRGYYLSDYERSKHHAELAAFGEAGTVEVVAVNPSSVQGPGRATGTGKIILSLLRGKLPFIIESDITLVDIDDCARGHLLAAERGQTGERYLLSGFTTTVTGAITLAGEVMGRELSTRVLPLGVARAGAATVAAVSRLAGRQPAFCPEMIRVVAHGHIHDGTRATRELGLAYTPAEETIRRLVDWFRTEGML